MGWLNGIADSFDGFVVELSAAAFYAIIWYGKETSATNKQLEKEYSTELSGMQNIVVVEQLQLCRLELERPRPDAMSPRLADMPRLCPQTR